MITTEIILFVGIVCHAVLFVGLAFFVWREHKRTII